MIPARAAILSTLLAACGVHAQQSDFEDLESRADYAYFTEDNNALQTVLQGARAALEKSAHDAGARYLVAFADYRLGLLAAEKSATSPNSARSWKSRKVSTGSFTSAIFPGPGGSRRRPKSTKRAIRSKPRC